MKKFILFIFIIFVASIIFIARLTRQGTSALKTEKVQRGTITKSVSASGEITSEEIAELKFQTSGQLAWVGVKEGERVQAWQALAQLDTRELQKTLEKYLRDYAKQRNDFEEMNRETYRGQTPSTALTNTVKRILEKNQWDLDKAVLDVELKDIALKYATLVTPISGIVTQVETPLAGINITPSTAVFKVSNPEKMIFKANLDETDIAGVVPGLKVQVTLDAYPEEKFAGEITKIAFQAITTSGGGTAFPTEITLPQNENFKFKLGMNGDAEIILQTKDDVLKVSSEVLMKSDDKNYVWLVVDKKAKKQEVQTGIEGEEAVEITSGLKENDRVIKSGTSKIKEGQKIDSQ